MTNYKEVIISELGVMQKKEQQERNVFKARAYGKVIAQVKGIPGDVKTMDDLKDVTGVGERIRVKLEEIFATGKLEAAEILMKDDTMAFVDALTKIYGVGPVKAKAIMKAYPKMRSIQELRTIVSDEPDVLNEKQLIGLKHYDDLLERIPRSEMKKHEMLLKKNLVKNLHGDLVGSFRRGADSSGDIDMLIGFPASLTQASANKAFQSYVQKLIDSGYVVDVLAQGPKKFMGVCRASECDKARRLDLLLTSPKEYPYALLYFTGSDKYNINVRKHALSLGYTLNEHGMKIVEKEEGIKPVPDSMLDEAAILAFLGLPYIEPNMRTGA